ncbi:MAG: LytTR family transcriptional regulator DNA-binding domain-containing protein [Bacteroidota bacterium]
MTAFRILIVEDEALYAGNLEMLVEELGYECLGVAASADQALKMIKKELPPDLVLMDINIKGEMDGISLAEKLNQKTDIPVIFISSLRDSETYGRAKAIRPYAFIGKPFDELTLQRTIELAVSRLAETKEEDDQSWTSDLLLNGCFFIKVKQKLVKVRFEDILYIEVEKQYCSLFTEEQKFVVRISLSELLNKLPEDLFLRTHRNFIVQVQKIDSFDLGESVVYVAGQSVAMSRSYRSQIMERLSYL